MEKNEKNELRKLIKDFLKKHNICIEREAGYDIEGNLLDVDYFFETDNVYVIIDEFI